MARRPSDKVLVVSGKGWSLFWPRDKWDSLTAAEQQDVRDTQTALLSAHNKVSYVELW